MTELLLGILWSSMFSLKAAIEVSCSTIFLVLKQPVVLVKIKLGHDTWRYCWVWFDDILLKILHSDYEISWHTVLWEALVVIFVPTFLPLS